MSDPREWTLKGGLFVYDRPGGPPGNQAVTHCDGPVPEMGEHVPVIEKSAYHKLQFEVIQLKEEASMWKAIRQSEDLVAEGDRRMAAIELLRWKGVLSDLVRAVSLVDPRSAHVEDAYNKARALIEDL